MKHLKYFKIFESLDYNDFKMYIYFCKQTRHNMPLVSPLSAEHNLETKKLAEFFNETLGFCPNSVLTMQRRPAISKAFINLNKAVMANESAEPASPFR